MRSDTEWKSNFLHRGWHCRRLHYRVWSKQKNAILCSVSREFESQPSFQPARELGLFWEFQSFESEFAYLPATWKRDKIGNIILQNQGELCHVVAYDKTEDFRVPHNFRNTLFFDAYSIRYHFKRDEALSYASLMMEANCNTEDRDDSLYVEEFSPALLHRIIGWGNGTIARIFP